MTNSRTFLEVISNVSKKDPKKIQFLHWIDTDLKKFIDKSLLTPNSYKNIILISKGSPARIGRDVMLAYDEDPMDGCLYLGDWNDGVA